MSAACPLIVCPDVCSPLGFPTRDQGVPRRWPSVKQWSKHWNPLISIRCTGLQWRPIVPIPIGVIAIGIGLGSINDTFLRRRVNTLYRHVSTAWKLYFHVPHFSCLCSVFFHVLSRGTYMLHNRSISIFILVKLKLLLLYYNNLKFIILIYLYY